MVTVLFYISASVLLGLSLFRLLWRFRHGALGGLNTVPGTVKRVGAAGSVEVELSDGIVVVDPGLAQVDTGIDHVGQRVTVALLQNQPVRLIRGVVPELRWLRWPQLAAALLGIILLLLIPVAERAAAGQVAIKVSRTVRAKAVASRSQKAPARSRLDALRRRLGKLHRRMGPVRPGDWLASHKEPGQTFRQYVASKPVHARGQRQVIYIQPIGKFSGKRKLVLDQTADFMSRYFCLPVRVAKTIPLSSIPVRARRRHPTWGGRQVLTTYILESVLTPRRPADAAAYIGFTTSDLWPGRGWNFVFGQASLSERVGVWSIHRNGDPDKDLERCLLRTLKTAVHETGHMFSMWHCTAYECNMCGSNSRTESDRRPITLCPECLAKTLWATGCDARARYAGLVDFFKRHKLTHQERIYRKLLEATPGR